MTDNFEFHPWDDYKDAKPVEVKVDGPPCKHCRYWKPQVKFNEYGNYDGIMLCTSSEMYHDFSCFRKKKDS